MSEPTYGSQYDPQQGYGQQQPYGGQTYGEQPSLQQPSQSQPYPSGQQPSYGGGGYGGGSYQPGYQQQPGGYPSGGYPAAAAPTPKPAQDKVALAATVLTIVGYVCAGAGVLGFILWLATDGGDGIGRFATALGTLVTGIGLGGLNYGLGVWLGERRSG
jgi:hypothetical protein